MPRVLDSYAAAFPLSPGCGVFLAIVGLAIVLGGFLRGKWILLAAGGISGTAGAMFAGTELSVGLPPPTRLQLWSLIGAIAVEMVLIRVLAHRLRPLGQRTVNLGMLVLVGAHFLLMIPAFGPLIAGLAVLVILNAVRGWRSPQVSFEAVWVADGFLKLLAGCLLLASRHLPI